MVKLYNFLVFSIASLFFGYVTLRMFFPLLNSRTHLLKGVTAILIFVLCFFVLWLADRYLVKKMSRRTAKITVFFLISINVVLQLICLNNLNVKPSWDFGAIMTASDDISAGRAIRNWGYFQEYPYNLYPAVILGSFKYLLGGNQSAPYILNIISVTMSIIGACLLSYRLYGQRAAVLAASLFIAVTPVYLYIPIVYTDTLSMPFVIWTVYIWSFIRTGEKKLILCCLLIGLLSAAGFLIKQIAAIGLTAFVIDRITDREKVASITHYKKKPLMNLLSGALPLAAALLSFFLVVSAFKFYVGYKGFDNRLDSNKSLPYTHWLMMGMNTMPSEGGTSSGYGGFSAGDLKYSRTYVTSLSKKYAEMEMIEKRLTQYGVNGYVKFLLKKIEWTWTDGTYFAPVKLARYPVQRTVLHKFVLFSNGKSNKLYLIFMQFVQTVLMSMILAGCIVSLKNNQNKAFRLMTLICLGLMIFLLFWETRSRYLVFMIPVFIVMAVYGMICTFGKLDAASVYLRKVLK